MCVYVCVVVGNSVGHVEHATVEGVPLWYTLLLFSDCVIAPAPMRLVFVLQRWGLLQRHGPPTAPVGVNPARLDLFVVMRALRHNDPCVALGPDACMCNVDRGFLCASAHSHTMDSAAHT
jgi:hypothetical protein